MPDTQNEWHAYRMHVLAEIERFNDTARSIDEKVEKLHRETIPDIKTRIALLEQRAALWGGGAGVLVLGLLEAIKRFTQ